MSFFISKAELICDDGVKKRLTYLSEALQLCQVHCIHCGSPGANQPKLGELLWSCRSARAHRLWFKRGFRNTARRYLYARTYICTYLIYYYHTTVLLSNICNRLTHIVTSFGFLSSFPEVHL